MSISISEKARLTIFADKNEAGRVGKAGSGSHTTFYILVFGLLKLSKNCLNP